VDDELRQSWAEFRFQVIAPLLDEKLDAAERAHVRKQILSRVYTTPDGKERRIAERTLRHWLKRFRKGQLNELENRHNKSHGEMKALDQSVLEKAKELRERMGTRSIQDILMHLKFTENIDVSKISASTLNRHLNRVGATKQKNYSELGIFQHFQKEHINQMWQSDCSDGLYLPDPMGLKEVRQTTLITCIDDASRFCVHGQFYWTEKLTDLLDCFKTALIARGRPSELYTDNGPIYRAKNFASICADLDVGLKHAEAYHPEGKGKQERYYLTLQTRFYKEAKKSGIATLQDLNDFFWAWLDECYHNVEHKTLKMTPLERWQQEEDSINRVSVEKLQQSMQLRTYRTVDDKTALIRLDGKRYQASKHLAGQKVQVRWPFDDHSTISIWKGGVLLEQAPQFSPSADIDYSKRPQRSPKAEEPKVLDCSKRFRLSLVARYRRQKPSADTSQFGVLSQREFIYIIEQCLNKQITQVETDLLSQYYNRLYPLDAEFVQQHLRTAITAKGSRMHLSFYLAILEEMKKHKR
jgi:putative transposase